MPSVDSTLTMRTLDPHPEPDSDSDVDETAPLLSSRSSPSSSPSRPAASPPADRLIPRATRWQAKTRGSVVAVISLLKFLITIDGMLIGLPVYRLFEDVLCHRYFEDDSPEMIDEDKCKGVDAVQAELAYLLAVMAAIGAALSLICAFPYGVMADRVGRKPVVVLAYVGLCIQFTLGPAFIWFGQAVIRRNIWLVSVGSVFTFLGGGIYVLFSTLYAMSADVSNEENRASSFLWLTLGATAGALLGPIMSGLLLEAYGPWVPVLVVVVTAPLIFIVFIFLPETLPIPPKSTDADEEPQQSLRQHFAQAAEEMRFSLSLLRNRNVLLVLSNFFLQSILFAGYTGTLTSYMHKHFGWKISEISYLLSPLSLAQVVLLAIMPALSSLVMRHPRLFRLSPLNPSFSKDALLARLSFLLLCAAGITQGLAGTVAVFLVGLAVGTLGVGHSPLCRAVITHFVEPERTSRLYALIGMVEMIGSFFGGPVLAWWFDLGMRKGGGWIGLPWFYLAVLCAVATVCLSLVAIPEKREEPDEGGLERVNNTTA